MRLTLGELRRLLREAEEDCWGGSRPEETYDELLEDDPAYKKRSVLVPDDIKEPISKWMAAMGLSRRLKKRAPWP